jgi:hypothetical protein
MVAIPCTHTRTRTRVHDNYTHRVESTPGLLVRDLTGGIADHTADLLKAVITQCCLFLKVGGRLEWFRFPAPQLPPRQAAAVRCAANNRSPPARILTLRDHLPLHVFVHVGNMTTEVPREQLIKPLCRAPAFTEIEVPKAGLKLALALGLQWDTGIGNLLREMGEREQARTRTAKNASLAPGQGSTQSR